MLKKLIFKIILTLLSSILIGFILLVLVYMIPTNRIRENINNSIEQYEPSGTNPRWAVGYSYTMLDEYTDATFILPNAIYPGAAESGDDQNPVRNAALTPHIDFVDHNNDIILALNGYNGESFKFNYVRYWHGYLVILKPLLTLMSLNCVRILNFIFEFVMTMLFMQLLAIKTRDVKLGLTFTLSLVLLNPVSTAMNFQLAAVYNVTILALLAVLQLHEKMNPITDAPVFFLLTGIIVVYFDFLTYPIISLVLPLLLYLWLQKDTLLTRTKSGLGYSALYLCSWGVGYVGMWLSKWILATIISGGEENAILESFQQIVYRSGHAEVKYSFAEVLVDNVRQLAIWPVIIMFGLIVLVLFISVLRNKAKLQLRPNIIIPLLFVALIPLMWYFGAREHSYDHSAFTFRNLAGTLTGFVLSVLCSLQKETRIDR